jgi:hypothetical protein
MSRDHDLARHLDAENHRLHALNCRTCHPERKRTMRLFDDDKIGVYLDAIGHRVERTSDSETKMVDLTCRVQPFGPELATSLDPDVRALLFNLSDAKPKPKLKTVHFDLTVPRQVLAIYPLPELEDGRIALTECEITGCRARTEKGVDGYALVFYVSFGPASPAELEYVCEWLTQQRFITFQPQAPALDFGKTEDPPPPGPPRRGRRRAEPAVDAGDELRPGVHAEH